MMDENLSESESTPVAAPAPAAAELPAAELPAAELPAAAAKKVAKRVAPVKVVAKKATPKKTAPVKAAPVKAAPVKAAPVKAAPVKAAPAKVAPPKQAAARKAAPKKAAPQKVVPQTRTALGNAAPDHDVTKKPAPEAVSVPALTAPVEAASQAQVQQAWTDNRLAQVLYHDWESGSYDEKWSISFDDRCISYARDRFSAVVGPEVLRDESWPYPKALEIGAGTGFFSLNLRQAGVLDEVHVSDVSAGMVQNAQKNASALGFEVQGTVAGAEALPYPDASFDLVVGHAVIHHIPDVEAALAEVLRVLKPGGRFVIAGEPSTVGDWYARRLGRVTWKLTTTVTRWPALRSKWAKSRDELDASSRAAALESIVDLHTFDPQQLQAMAERAGAQQVRTQSEELLAAVLGWPVRTFEAAVNPEALGLGWAMFAYRSWQRLSALDRVLARALPASIFYNVGVTGTKPADA